MSRNNGKLGEYEGFLKLGLVIAAIYIIYKLGNNIISKLGQSVDVSTAKTQAEQQGPVMRIAVLQSYAQTINEQVKGWTNGGYTIQETLKKLANADEVRFLANYYRNQFTRYLLTDVKTEMGSWASWSKPFESLPDFIKDNLS